MAEDCAVIARALMLAEENVRPDDPAHSIRAYRLAFQALTVALAYSDTINQAHLASVEQHLQELWFPKDGER